MKRHTLGLGALTLFILSIPAANWAFQVWGAVPILLGYEAPAAALVVGFTFLARDYVHRAWGVGACLAAIAAGTALSVHFSPALALASGAAFAASELTDLTVLQKLRKKGWSRAVAASNVAGAIVDSLIFLWLAFHSLAFLPGQLMAKLVTTLIWLAGRELRGSSAKEAVEDLCLDLDLCPVHRQDAFSCRDDAETCLAGRA